MISDEMAKKLKESGIFIKSERAYGKMMQDMVIYYHPSKEHSDDTFSAPTFEDLWERLPPLILKDESFWLNLKKHAFHSEICYISNEHEEMIIIDSIPDKSLSDLAAEMLIELKKRGMIE